MLCGVFEAPNRSLERYVLGIFQPNCVTYHGPDNMYQEANFSDAVTILIICSMAQVN